MPAPGPPAELTRSRGAGRPRALELLAIVLGTGRPAGGGAAIEVLPEVRAPADVAAHLAAPGAGSSRSEEFARPRVVLDQPSRVRRDVLVSRGLLNSALVHPREVFRAAIAEAGAGIILAHNHPSGDPTPSAEDRAATRQLVEAGRLLDLPVYDREVIAERAIDSCPSCSRRSCRRRRRQGLQQLVAAGHPVRNSGARPRDRPPRSLPSLGVGLFVAMDTRDRNDCDIAPDFRALLERHADRLDLEQIDRAFEFSGQGPPGPEAHVRRGLRLALDRGGADPGRAAARHHVDRQRRCFTTWSRTRRSAWPTSRGSSAPRPAADRRWTHQDRQPDRSAPRRSSRSRTTASCCCRSPRMPGSSSSSWPTGCTTCGPSTRWRRRSAPGSPPRPARSTPRWRTASAWRASRRSWRTWPSSSSSRRTTGRWSSWWRPSAASARR